MFSPSVHYFSFLTIVLPCISLRGFNFGWYSFFLFFFNYLEEHPFMFFFYNATLFPAIAVFFSSIIWQQLFFFVSTAFYCNLYFSGAFTIASYYCALLHSSLNHYSSYTVVLHLYVLHLFKTFQLATEVVLILIADFWVFQFLSIAFFLCTPSHSCAFDSLCLSTAFTRY